MVYLNSFNDEWEKKSNCEYKICWNTCKGKKWTLNNAIEQKELAWR